jgi:hypothetical protein
VKETYSHVRRGKLGCELLSFFLLVATAAVAQNSSRALVVKMVHNELNSQKQPGYWMYLDSKKEPEKSELNRVIQTPECWLSWPVAVDGRAPTREEAQHARKQLEALLNDPKARKKNRGQIDADGRKSAEMLRMLPDAFLFTRDGMEGKSLRLTFRPNPEYEPPNSEAKVFHHMEGVLLIDAEQVRLVRLSGTLVSAVDFGFGIFGRLEKGGSFEVVQSEVAPGDWEVSLLDVHITGRALFFHAIGEQQHEVRTQFQPVPSDLSLVEAASRVAGNAKSSQMGWHGGSP